MGNTYNVTMGVVVSLAFGLFLFAAANGSAQTPEEPAKPADPATPATAEQPPPDKRVLGVLPNYRTANETAIYTPISTKHKYVIGCKDSFDYPLVMLAGIFAGFGQLSNQHPQFGQGMEGFAKRLGTGYVDQALGNLMTESIWPSMLHEDQRYFRRGTGTVKSRTWYAVTRIFVTRVDSDGHRRFNYSELLGNASAVAFSNVYYTDTRTVVDNLQKLGTQLGTDALSQVLKEFWPDVKRKLFKPPKTA